METLQYAPSEMGHRYLISKMRACYGVIKEDFAVIQPMTDEGSLDILWMNAADKTATPRFDVVFLSYAHAKNGAQQPKKIVGTFAIETYLVELGFTAEDARFWVRQASQRFAVSIPNVVLVAACLADFGL
ncbi:MAG: hypothetical protein WBE97_02125 [Candidatus Acidiferrales bacterium]